MIKLNTTRGIAIGSDQLMLASRRTTTRINSQPPLAISSTILCWGLGGFGVGLTGALKVNTKEDMAENSRMIVLWGANIASQPNTARHIISARRRGAKVVTIDVRRTEAAAQSDEVLLIRPGSDAALALAVMHVIITEKRYDPAFVAAHTTGFEELSTHVLSFAPAWASKETGLEASQ